MDFLANLMAIFAALSIGSTPATGPGVLASQPLVAPSWRDIGADKSSHRAPHQPVSKRQ